MSARPDFFSARNVDGRRDYQCEGCRCALPKGALHTCVSSRSMGETWSKRYCLGCAVEAGVQISIKAGASSIVLGPDGVSITGSMVKINSGGSPGSGAGASPVAPTDPDAPDAPEVPEDPLTHR